MTWQNEAVKTLWPMVVGCATAMKRKAPRADLDDLISAAAEGLLDAMDRWEPGRRPLAYFARGRIWGAMKDWLRGLDRLPRTARDKVNRLQAARLKLIHETGFYPNEDELADELCWDAYTVREVCGWAREWASLDEVPADFKRQPGTIDRGAADPYRSAMLADLKDFLYEHLFCDDAKVLDLYYCQGWTCKQIGAEFGRSETWASIILPKIVSNLRFRVRTARAQRRSEQWPRTTSTTRKPTCRPAKAAS